MQTTRKNHMIIGSAVATLLALGMLVRPPLWYYTNFTLRPHALPSRLIRTAIKFSTGHAAPGAMQDAKGLIRGGRDPSVFIGFRTDDAGIQYILREFGGPDVTTEVWDDELLRSGANVFASVLSWQKKLGIRVYDQDPIHSAKVLTRLSLGGLEPSYTLLIDDERHAVYIRAAPHH